jgi:hypothetical protein
VPIGTPAIRTFPFVLSTMAGERRGPLRSRCTLSISEGCLLMGLARSTYYDLADEIDLDTEIVSRIKAIGDEFEAYGYRRLCAELRRQGLVSRLSGYPPMNEIHRTFTSAAESSLGALSNLAAMNRSQATTANKT